MLSARDIGTAVLEAQIVKHALKPVNEPMVRHAFAFGLYRRAVGKLSNQNIDSIWQDHFEAVGDKGWSDGDVVGGHWGLLSPR